MPFGLTTTPAVFQAHVNDVPWDMLNCFALISSQNEQEHVQHVRQVLPWLLENQLFIKAEKCEFHIRTVSFLGYIVSAGSIQMDPQRSALSLSGLHPPTASRDAEVPGVCSFL